MIQHSAGQVWSHSPRLDQTSHQQMHAVSSTQSLSQRSHSKTTHPAGVQPRLPTSESTPIPGRLSPSIPVRRRLIGSRDVQMRPSRQPRRGHRRPQGTKERNGRRKENRQRREQPVGTITRSNHTADPGTRRLDDAVLAALVQSPHTSLLLARPGSGIPVHTAQHSIARRCCIHSAHPARASGPADGTAPGPGLRPTDAVLSQNLDVMLHAHVILGALFFRRLVARHARSGEGGERAAICQCHGVNVMQRYSYSTVTTAAAYPSRDEMRGRGSRRMAGAIIWPSYRPITMRLFCAGQPRQTVDGNFRRQTAYVEALLGSLNLEGLA